MGTLTPHWTRRIPTPVDRVSRYPEDTDLDGQTGGRKGSTHPMLFLPKAPVVIDDLLPLMGLTSVTPPILLNDWREAQ